MWTKLAPCVVAECDDMCPWQVNLWDPDTRRRSGASQRQQDLGQLPLQLVQEPWNPSPWRGRCCNLLLFPHEETVQLRRERAQSHFRGRRETCGTGGVLGARATT